MGTSTPKDLGRDTFNLIIDIMFRCSAEVGYSGSNPGRPNVYVFFYSKMFMLSLTYTDKVTLM